jgi:hypothetical protein
MCLANRRTVAMIVMAVGVIMDGRGHAADEPLHLEVKLKEIQPIKHADGLRSMVFSRDGKLLLTASEDHTARLWETATGRPVGRVFNHGDIIKDAAMSPDGKVVATAGKDQWARLWDVKTGSRMGRNMRHLGAVNSVAFSPNGKQLLTGSDDGTARLWNAATGELVGYLFQHPHQVNHAAFLPDGRTVVTACWDLSVRKWDVATGKEIGQLCSERFGANSLSISRDGRLLLTGSRDRGGRLWEIATGKPLADPITPDDYFTDVAFSPDARTFLAASARKMTGAATGPSVVQLWDTATLRPIGVPFRDQNCLAFHPSGKIIATAGDNGVVQIREINVRRPGPRLVDAIALESFWADLAGNDAPRAFRAVLTLTDVPDNAVPFLQKHLKPAPLPDEKRLLKLIADLDDDAFDVRNSAQQELAAAGREADPLLRVALDKNPSLEVKQRLRRLLDQVGDSAPGAEQLRAIRSLQVLEAIGTAEARELLRTLAKGAPGADLTRESAQALERLGTQR